MVTQRTHSRGDSNGDTVHTQYIAADFSSRLQQAVASTEAVLLDPQY